MQESTINMYLHGVPTEVKNDIDDIVHQRKKNGNPRESIKSVALELWQKALALPEYKEYFDGSTSQPSPNA
ncbi:hypothetical protein BKI52_32875 [marine bacterium AO1-C]|nr:hypothetical protein BKI52_32875 [marine bacterium AO1-C]